MTLADEDKKYSMLDVDVVIGDSGQVDVYYLR